MIDRLPVKARRPIGLTFRLYLAPLNTFRAEAWYDGSAWLEGFGRTPRGALRELADAIADRLGVDFGTIREIGPILVSAEDP